MMLIKIGKSYMGDLCMSWNSFEIIILQVYSFLKDTLKVAVVELSNVVIKCRI